MSWIIGVLTIVAMVAIAFAGWLWRQWQHEKQKREEVESRVGELEGKVQTLKYWAFGNPRDETDDGLVFDIEDGFRNVSERIDSLEDRVDVLIQELHDDEDTDFDRDDL